MYPDAPTTQNFASCVQLCRWRRAWVARARRPGATAASRCSMTAADPSDSGGCAAFGSDSDRLVVRNALPAFEQHCEELAVAAEDDVPQLARVAPLPRHRPASERLQRGRPR